MKLTQTTMYCIVTRHNECSPLYESLERLLVDAKRLQLGRVIIPAANTDLPYFLDMKNGEIAGFVMCNKTKGAF